jgi:hypothetical protein
MKKFSFGFIVLWLITLVTWLALRAAHNKQPDNHKLGQASKGFLGAWIVLLVGAVASVGVWTRCTPSYM